VTDGRDILVADDAAAFAEATVRLLTDAELNKQVTLAGRQTAVQRYDYRQACRPLDDIYAAQTQP
jgi:glycosyltransferase involved in cell wall biosynthesis